MDKKQTAIIYTIITVIVTVIIIFSVVGHSSDSMVKAADSVVNNCSLNGAGYYYDSAVDETNCTYNGAVSTRVMGETGLPLSGLFGSDGVALIVFMAMNLLTIVVFVFYYIKRNR